MSNYKNNLKKGYFKVTRSIFKHDVWLSEPFSRGQAWIDLIGYMTAYKYSYFFVRGNRVDQPRGWACTSIKSMSERWKWSQGKVNRFLKFLENEEQIKVDRTPIITKIQILNYDKYQPNEEQTDEQIEEQTENKQEDRQSTIKESNSKGNESIKKERDSNLSDFFDLTIQEDKNKVFPPAIVEELGIKHGYYLKEMKKAYDNWLLKLIEKSDEVRTIKQHRAGFEQYLINCNTMEGGNRYKKNRMQSR